MDLKKSYFEDIRLFNHRSERIWALILLAVLAGIPFYFTKSYYLSIINLMAIHAIVALGLNMLVGNTGQISLGHAGFVAIGAYTVVMLMKVLNPLLPAGLSFVAFLLVLVLAGLVAAFFGAILGLPSLKLEGPYLAIATLGFGLAVTVVIGRMDVFGGRMGLHVPRLELGWSPLSYDRSLYMIIITLTVLMTLFARNILKSRIGRAFQAIRDSDIAASAIGINLARYKTLSFAISAFYAGLAGGLWALYLGFINPTIFTFVLSIKFLAIIIVGGLGSVTGSVLGAVLLTFLDLQLQNVPEIPLLGPALVQFSETFMSASGISNISWVFMGLTLIGIIIFEPLGLYGLWLRVKIYWKTWPF
ncbi:MAG: branched-chain amino acid ABC transporter permease [Bacteroidetes bacterium]|nr:MAG: branched-chain amino acid ABC transporter permease [Bacteroidota bacterium]